MPRRDRARVMRLVDSLFNDPTLDPETPRYVFFARLNQLLVELGKVGQGKLQKDRPGERWGDMGVNSAALSMRTTDLRPPMNQSQLGNKHSSTVFPQANRPYGGSSPPATEDDSSMKYGIRNLPTGGFPGDGISILTPDGLITSVPTEHTQTLESPNGIFLYLLARPPLLAAPRRSFFNIQPNNQPHQACDQMDQNGHRRYGESSVQFELEGSPGIYVHHPGVLELDDSPRYPLEDRRASSSRRAWRVWKRAHRPPI
jgi:hypothetical protein